MAGRDDEPFASMPQSWSTVDKSVPMVVVAPPEAEPSTTRGATGVFVLLILVVGLVVAVWQFYGAWNAIQRYREQERVTVAAANLLEYVDDLEEQNERMRTTRTVQTAPEPPLVQVAIDRSRRDYDLRCGRFKRREGGAECISAYPAR